MSSTSMRFVGVGTDRGASRESSAASPVGRRTVDKFVSMYAWQGVIEDENLALVVLHTRQSLVPKVLDRASKRASPGHAAGSCPARHLRPSAIPGLGNGGDGRSGLALVPARCTSRPE